MDLVKIGYISKTHGLKGECVLKIEGDTFFDEEEINAIFLDLNGAKAPFFIEDLSWNNSAYIVKLEGINKVEEAKRLIGKTCLIDRRYLIENENSMSKYIGYHLIEKEFGDLGQIEEIIDQTNNVLIRLTYRGKEILLPFTEDLISLLDDESKKMYYSAPQGLISMYLN